MALRTSMAALLLVLLALLANAACRTPGAGTPIIDNSPKPTEMDGTIAGHVRAEGNMPVASRRVRAVSLETGQRYETATGDAGTYTLKVPPGRYRLELQLQAGERLVREPGETTVNKSDLDPDRDFQIATSR